MPEFDSEQLEIIGIPPAAAGRRCEEFVCQEFRNADGPASTAHITYLKFEGSNWFRLYFEFRTVFWHDIGPVRPAFDFDCLDDPIDRVDVAVVANIRRIKLQHFEMMPTEGGSRVVFRFENDRTITIDDADDVATFVLEPAP